MSNSTEVKNNIIKVGWECPSNIALVKYWGKYGRQLPCNSSISFTLSHAATRTFMTLGDEHSQHSPKVNFTFEGNENAAFQGRIEKFLASISEYFPFVLTHQLTIDSSNSFPHSSGIASSASGMGALALCLCDIDDQLNKRAVYNDDFYHRSSIIARLGSGSASRSVFGVMATWGKHQSIIGSSDEYAVPMAASVHPKFHTFHDDILIISPKEKSVSSSAGHHLMEGNPYAAARYKQAGERMRQLLSSLHTGDLDTFGKITEDEALTLHALMMCSDPSYILMEPNSLLVIKKIKQFRAESGLPVYFTLDAGPNVHVLYPDQYEVEINHFIISELKPLCHEGKIIRDKVNIQGPSKLI